MKKSHTLKKYVKTTFKIFYNIGQIEQKKQYNCLKITFGFIFNKGYKIRIKFLKNTFTFIKVLTFLFKKEINVIENLKFVKINK